MAIFGKRFQPARGGADARVKALEDHVRYMEEMLEYYARQNERRLTEQKGAQNTTN